MIPFVILIVSFLLDGLLTNYLPYLVQDLSLFTPMFTITSIFLIYPFFRKQELKFFIILFLVGILYDLFYTNLLFFNGSMFVILGFISYYIQKNFDFGFFNNIVFVIIMISSYEIITCLFLWIYNIVPVSFSGLFYKISHSLLLNIIYMEGVYYLVKVLPKKYKKISIN